MLNRPVELFSQVNALLPLVFSSYDDFIMRYCDAKPNPFAKGTMDAKGSSNPKELNSILEGIVMIRRLKEDVLSELPDKKREIRYIQPDPIYAPELKRIKDEQNIYNAALKAPCTAEEKARLKKLQDSLILRYQQITGLSKVPGVCEILKDIIKYARLATVAQEEAEETLAEDSMVIASGSGRASTYSELFVSLLQSIYYLIVKLCR